MPKSKVKLRRARFDGAYIFASVFVAFGCLALLGSYADHKPLPTFSPGTYSLGTFATDRAGEYSLGIQRGLRYCFSPYQVTSGAVISVLPSSGNQQTLSLAQTTTDTACFHSDSSYDRVNVRLPAITPPPTTLTVRQ